MTPSITINEFKKSIHKKACPLDVRRKTDVQATGVKIPGAVWQDPETIDTWITQLPADQPILVYCVRGGSVSQSVTDRLRQKRLKASFLEGGIKGWIDSNQDIVQIHIPNNAYEISREDMDLLHKAKLSDEDIAHSLKVAQKALGLPKKITDVMEKHIRRGADAKRGR